MTADPKYSLAVADWRREVHAMYAGVRAESSPQQAHALWVGWRTDLFNRHPASPRQPGQELRHADYDPSFRFVTRIGAADGERLDVPTGTDGVVPFDRIGRVTLDLPRRRGPAALDVWWLASYGGGVFIPLRDGTAGSSTYGAGRYLIDTVKGADLGREHDDEWILDLNFAYNPSCVYDSRWACPLAPPGNQFGADVPVGELLPTGYGSN